MSYGRPRLQITLQNLPPKVQQQVELWVVPSQYKEYKREWASTVKSIEVWPTHIDCVPKKRQWLAQNMESNYFVLDDDVGMYVWDRRAGRYNTAKADPKAFAHEFLDVLPTLYDDHKCVSLASKFMAEQHARKSLIKHNTVGFVVTGFCRGTIQKLVKRDQLWFNKTFMFTDLAIPLQVLQATRSSVCYYGLVYNHSTVKELSVTGTATYRDDFVKLDSALKMARMFPGIVTGAKENGNRGGGMTIQKWFQRAVKGVKPQHVQASKDYVRSVCEEHGLIKPPKIFQYPDEMPRDEIIATFKRNWKRAKQEP
jgi:hypothetical protein